MIYQGSIGIKSLEVQTSYNTTSCHDYDKLHIYSFSWKKIEKTMGSKPWEQNHLLKTMGPKACKTMNPKLGCRLFKKFYKVIILFYLVLYIYIYLLMEKNRENHGTNIMGSKSWSQNHKCKVLESTYKFTFK